jgi:hypothetical protein
MTEEKSLTYRIAGEDISYNSSPCGHKCATEVIFVSHVWDDSSPVPMCGSLPRKSGSGMGEVFCRSAMEDHGHTEQFGVENGPAVGGVSVR